MKTDFYKAKMNGSISLNLNSASKINRKISASICVCLWLVFLCFNTNAQTLAPGAPGKDAQWATAGKQAVGTSAGLESKIWFTLAQGVMTEVYYPDVTVANVHLLQFVVVNPKNKKVETEQLDALHEVKVLRPDSLSFQQINTAKSGAWKVTKTYTTDTESNTVLIDVLFEQKNKTFGDYELYVYYDPSLGNSGMKDSAWAIKDSKDETQNALMAQDGNISSALMIEHQGEIFLKPFVLSDTTNGFFGTNDGLTQLKEKKSLVNFEKAENGNVVQFAKIKDREREINSSSPLPFRFKLALGFGKTPDEALKVTKTSLSKGFTNNLEQYEKGWSDYVKTLRKVEPKYQAQFNMAAMQLRSLEDKTIRGANIASLTVPWGGGLNANENNIGGYHLIWSRDLYQAATAFMALGDKAAAIRALDFLFKVQQKPDGSFPQNSYLDGKPFWGSTQHDEVAFPLILAYQLGRNDKATYENHVRRAADFIVKTGPKTPQERWEEEGGYSPSTIAAEIAGLVCAAEIARLNNDAASADLYLKTADEWHSKIEKWTVTTTGKYSKEPYYVRITQNGKPDAGERIELNNGAGFFDERDIVDAGFLELVRLGIKLPDDPIIQNSLKVIDEVIRVKTPNGDAFYRYNHDGYGEMDDGRRWNWDGKYTGKGRLWALLSGERGQYELAKCQKGDATSDFKCGSAIIGEAKKRLDNMLAFANDGLMIPEQIWDKPTAPNADKQFVPELKFGEGTGSATPLAWSMAQFIRLAVNLQEGRNLDTPDVVYNRYVLGKKSEVRSEKSEENKPSDTFGEIRTGGEIKAEDVEKLPLNRFAERAKLISPNNNSLTEDICEAARKYVPKGNGIMSEPRKDEPSPQVFAGKREAKTAMLFTYFGAEKTIEIAGDFTGWKPCGLKFQDFPKSKILVLEFPNTARVEYKLIVDGKWINDPLNPNKVDNGVGGENSFFTMPDYQPTNLDGGETPKLETIEIDSKIYGKSSIQIYQPTENVAASLKATTSIASGETRRQDQPFARTLKVSNTPANYSTLSASESFSFANVGFYPTLLNSSASPTENAMPVLYLQDGGEYINRAKAIQVQRNLVKAGKIKSFIMVFLDPKDRMKEYWANDDYAKFVATEVVPAIDAKYKTVKSPSGRAIMGASLGGITSVHAALKYPEIFGRVGGQSSSFWVDNERVVKDLEKLDGKTKFKFYFDDGTLEGVEDSRKVVKILKDKGFDVTYVEGEAGHNWTAWRDRLADAFTAIWK